MIKTNHHKISNYFIGIDQGELGTTKKTSVGGNPWGIELVDIASFSATHLSYLRHVGEIKD